MNYKTIYDWGYLEWSCDRLAMVYNKNNARIGEFDEITGAILTEKGFYCSPGLFPPTKKSNEYWLKKFATTDGRNITEIDIY